MSDKDFSSFLTSGKKTPSHLDNLVLSQVKSNLLKDQIYALINVVSIHAIAGTATLAICPQFGWNPLGGNPHITHLFMAYGTWACGMFCGALFMGLGSFLKLFLLQKRTLIIYERKEVFNSLIVSGFFLVILMSAGKIMSSENIFFTAIFLVFWLIGSALTELLSYLASKYILKRA